MQIFTTPNYDFIRWRWPALALSLIVIAAGAAMILSRGLQLGVDFSGGTSVILKFDQEVTEDQVRTTVSSLSSDVGVQRYGEPQEHEWLIRLPQGQTTEQGASLEQDANRITEALQKASLPSFQVISRELVGPVIGADLQRRGVYATLASLLAITLYIAVRFRFSFAVGAIAATFHDILVTLAFLVFFGYELSLNVVAAILTITGYSVNDTIVVFDRVRENMRSMRRETLTQVVNASVNQTLARTVITAGTTFLAVLALYLFGGEVLHGFAFTMLVGIISGTYSTVFIASAIAIILGQRRRTATQAATAPPRPDARPGRKARGARAS